MVFTKWHMPLYNGIVSARVTIDRAGRIVLPKPVRDELRLSPGDILDLTIQADGVTLRPRRAATPLQKERGIWVFRTGKPLSELETEEILDDIRTARHRRSAGETQ